MPSSKISGGSIAKFHCDNIHGCCDSLSNNEITPDAQSVKQFSRTRSNSFASRVSAISNSSDDFLNRIKTDGLNPGLGKIGDSFIICKLNDGKHEFYMRTGEVLPRGCGESYIPWGITTDSSVIYAKYGEHRGFNELTGRAELKKYTSKVSRERRGLCQSELGGIILNNREYTAEAVDDVSRGVRNYLLDNYVKEPDLTLSVVVKNIGHYFFTNGQKSFGRISEDNASILSSKYIWNSIIFALDFGTLEQKMAIHDAVGRKVLPLFKGAPLKAYNAIGEKVRREWFDKKEFRGRVNRGTKGQETITAGIANDRHVNQVGVVRQARNRGVDIFERDINRKFHPEANDFYDDLDTRNLLFGAGISGTTGTLLQAAHAFGNLKDIEHKKQYVLATMGYLVGGGMHSYHEVMTVASKVGIPYSSGAYIESLPESFKNSNDFQQWNHHYYDISSLGAIHWLFNETK